MKDRKLNYFIFSTIVGCCISIIIVGTALGTAHWVEAKAVSSAVTADVYYGLMSGRKTNTLTIGQGVQISDIKLTCRVKDNICMYSSGSSKEIRKAELEALWLNKSVSKGPFRRILKSGTGTKDAEINETVREKKLFLNYGLWIVTVLFLAGTIIFSLMAGLQALYNTYRSPSLPVFNVFGLYIWNSVSAGCTLLAMILWGAAFGNLKKNLAITETIASGYSADDSKLGYSFWILILAEVSSLANIGIIRYRSWKMLQQETKEVVVQDKSSNPTSILF